MGHYIKVTLDYGNVVAEYSCNEPDSAECRNTCLSPLCHDGCITSCDKTQLKPLNYCNAVDWLSNSGEWYEMHCGTPGISVHSGEIIPVWNRDGFYEWKYVDERE